MKNRIALAVVISSGMLFLTSCGGAGWTEDTKGATKTACGLMVMDYTEADGSAICDCYVNKLVEKYPDGKLAENDATIDECKSTFKTKAAMEEEAMMQKAAQMAQDSITAAAAAAPAK